MIAVALRLVARPEAREELARRVRDDLLAPTRAEPGCIRYRFYQDIEDESAFSFVEEWESWEAMNGHFRSDHVGRFLGGVGDLLASDPEARFYEVARTRGMDAVMEARAALPA